MKEYTIRELADLSGVTTRTLRWYDQIGLLKPGRVAENGYYEDEGILTNVGRTSSGQRVFTDGHVNRLRTICCFKNTGMTIAELKQFFAYEADEPAHLDDILMLLRKRKTSVTAQLAQLQEDYAHVLRKIHYYEDIQESLRRNQPLPQWKDYKRRTYDE